MPCYHPLKGFVIGTTDSGKKKLHISSFDSSFQDYNPDIECILIPCGQCIGCRLEYSRQWAIRCMLESEYHEENYFLTLTYNDDSIVDLKREYRDTKEYLKTIEGDLDSWNDSDVPIKSNYTLSKVHLQLFCKRLRSQLSRDGFDTFRFFACGEYGSQTQRPHYHMIAFGLHIPDLKFYKNSASGPLYTSEYLNNIWGKGYVIIGSVTFESCAYVSRYILKKQKGKGAYIYDYLNIEPEFTNMSRRPGIAKAYFDDNFEDIYRYDSVVLPGGSTYKPPRYYDKLFSDTHGLEFEDVKEKRLESAALINHFKLQFTDVDAISYLEVQENNVNSRLKKLVRPL